VSTYRYCRITNPDIPLRLHCDATDTAGVSQCREIDAAEFTTTVGERPAEGTADVKALLGSTADTVRAFMQQTRKLPFGAETVWRLDEEKGIAEGWQVDPPPAG
jgi:hypothetical protein